MAATMAVLKVERMVALRVALGHEKINMMVMKSIKINAINLYNCNRDNRNDNHRNSYQNKIF
jgi:hypothetical protein